MGVELLAEGFGRLTNSAVAPGDRDGLYVSQQAGPLWRVDVRDGGKQMVADLSGLLVPVGLEVEGGQQHLPDERGFLGLAFHPDFERATGCSTRAPPSQRTAVSRPSPRRCRRGRRPTTSVCCGSGRCRGRRTAPAVDPNSSRVLFRIAQPQWNHNGGELVFGPDGMLHVQLGDGGGADDQNGQMWWIDPDDDGIYAVGPIVGHVDGGNTQDLGVPLGKILRIPPSTAGAPHTGTTASPPTTCSTVYLARADVHSARTGWTSAGGPRATGPCPMHEVA